MVASEAPGSLGDGGAALWRSVTSRANVDGDHLDALQLVVLEEACRLKDRLDRLNACGHGEVFVRVGGVSLVVGDPGKQANQTADTFKKLLAALRLPDPVTGRRPQRRGPRGVQRPSVPGGRGPRDV